MLNKIRLALIGAIVLCAMFLLPGVSFAASYQAHTGSNWPTASFAFTGLITSGQNQGTVLTGGLTITIGNDGYFHGNFHEPDGTQVSVSGQAKQDGSLTIAFYTPGGQPFIRGEGMLNGNEYTGPFQVYSGDKQIASGIWSALAVADPSKVLALAFTGKTLSGPDKGAMYEGAIVLNSQSLAGTFNLPDGTVVMVQGKLKHNGHIKVVFDLGGNKAITGYGKPVNNGNEKGFAGPYFGPATGDKGWWSAYFFGF
jgi:hypothetical protein